MVSWDTVALSYSSGLLAAVSPCVVVLIPLVLFRFMNDKRKPAGEPKKTPHRDVLLFAIGFQFSYLLFGYFLSQLLTSSIQNGFKIGLGSLFVMLSALSITNRLDPMQMPLFDNTFLMGVSFALLLSFNPCTVPFLAVIISLNTRDALLALLCFGQGLLTPSLIFIYLGRGCINMIKKKGQIMHWLNKVMSAMLGMMGVYLIFATPVMAVGDLAVAGIMGVGTGLLALSSLSLIDLSPSESPPTAASALSRCCTRVTTAIPRPARVALVIGLVLTLVVGFICWGAQYEGASHTALLMDTLQSKVSPVSESIVPEVSAPEVEVNVDITPAAAAAAAEEPIRYSYRKRPAVPAAAAVPVESPSASPASPAAAAVTDDDYDEPVERMVLDEVTGVISAAASPSLPPSRRSAPAPRGPPSPLDAGEHDDPDGEATCIDTSKIPECGPCRFCINAHAALACLGFAATVVYHLYDTRRSEHDRSC